MNYTINQYREKLAHNANRHLYLQFFFKICVVYV